MTHREPSKPQTLVSPISHTLKPYRGPVRPTKSKYGLIKQGDSSQIRFWKTLAVGAIVFSFTAPIFRSGGRRDLTFWGWLRNHTIYGNPVEYVPFESYSQELEGTWIDEEGNLRW